MDNFVDYLDNCRLSTSINYFDVVNIANAANIHYFKNNLNDAKFTGDLSYYNNFSKSIWNTSSNTAFSKYELWQKKHETDISFNFTIPSIKKYNVDIDVTVNSIGDFIQLIDNNPYKVDTEYNIDLKSLHNIRTELVELNNMIGMKQLKESVLNQLIYFIQELNVGTNSNDFKHTVICGPPGTGKTEIAKIIGRMYSKIGILKKNVFKKVTRNDLVAGYLGQTAIKTKAVITECLGGCLFIDEAYSLANSNNNDLDSYSKECIDVLCEALSDHKDNLMVIIAGYEEELNNTFFKANRGLESRFIWRFKIDDYKPKDMMDIFHKKVKENGWECMDDSVAPLQWFDKKKDDFKFFGRDMELLFSHIKISHARRIYGKSKDWRKKITAEDMETGFKKFVENSKKKEENNTTLCGLYL